jgi:hypothetical protein
VFWFATGMTQQQHDADNQELSPRGKPTLSRRTYVIGVLALLGVVASFLILVIPRPSNRLFTTAVVIILFISLLIAVVTWRPLWISWKHGKLIAGAATTATAATVAVLTLLQVLPSEDNSPNPTPAPTLIPSSLTPSGGSTEPLPSLTSTSPVEEPIDSFDVKADQGSKDIVIKPGGKVTQPITAKSRQITHLGAIAGCNDGLNAHCPGDRQPFGNVRLELLRGDTVIASVDAPTNNNAEASSILDEPLIVNPGEKLTLRVKNTTNFHTGFYFKRVPGEASATINQAYHEYEEGKQAGSLAARVSCEPPGC